MRAALRTAGINPTLEKWLAWNGVTASATDVDAELLEVLPTEFREEYDDWFRLNSEYEAKFVRRTFDGSAKSPIKFSTICSMTFLKIWSDLEPYILQVLLGATTLFVLLKDREDYVKKVGRFWTVVTFIATTTIFGLTLLETHATRRETREKERTADKRDAANTKQIDVLTEQVRLEREENKQNSDGFRLSFAALYNKYSELASRTNNSGLLQELHRTQNDLRDTQSKLDQPKATLTASFWTSGMSSENLSRDKVVSRRPDGSVSIDVIVLNPSDVAALNGAYTIRICETCKFAKEPAGLSLISGSPEYDRQKAFDRILSKTGDERRTIEIIPPPSLPFGGRFEVDVLYRCVNCISDKVPLWVTFQ